MSTKPAITEGHISRRQDGRSGRVMRVAVICACIGVVLTVALAAAAVRGAGAAPQPNKNAPVANSQSAVTTNEDTVKTITLTATDRNGDSLTFAITQGPSHGTLGSIATPTCTGTKPSTCSANVTYTPANNFNGSDSFQFQAKDRRLTSNTATISITVDPVNDAPVAEVDSANVDEGDTVTGNVLSKDTDVDGDVLQAVLVSGPDHASSFTLNADGSFSYTHDGSETTSDSFTYKANDGTAGSNIATVNITINPVNDAPVANDALGNTNEDNSTTITLSGTDAGGDDLTFEITDPPDNGQLGTIVPVSPTIANVTYTPNLNYNGPDSFTYKAKDGHGGEDTATVSITVSPVNDAPSFTAGGDVTVNQDSGAYSATWATAISAGPADENGQNLDFLVSNNNSALFSDQHQPAISSSGTLTFTPAPNAFGSAIVTVVLTDNGGILNGGNDTSVAQQFTITVTAVNDAPSFTKGADQTVNEDAGAQTVNNWASDISAGPNESGQTLTFQVTNDNNALFSNQPAISADGTLSYTPAANAFGTATVSVTLHDDGGTANGGDDTSDTKTFTITVNPVNDAPVAKENDGPYTVNEDTTLTVTAPGVLLNDTDADRDALSVSRFRCGSTENGSLRLNADGSFSYTPGPNYNGTDSFGYRVNDGTADSNCATVTITVNSVNDPPVVDLDSEDRAEPGINTTVEFTERFSEPGFPPDTCCPVVLAPRTTVSDVDDTMLESAEIKLTNHPDGNDESLSVDLDVLRGTSIDGLQYDPETGILALFGPDTPANFQKVLRTVKYDNREEPADRSDRLVTFKVNDGEADSQIATATVLVRCDSRNISCAVDQ
jgi:large repetitive protein